MRRRKDDGVTLLELLIVVALLSIIAAFALRRLERARIAANEASAISSLRSVAIAQDLFARVCGAGNYATSLSILGAALPGAGQPLLSADLSSSDTPGKAGYVFGLGRGAGAEDGRPDCHGGTTTTRFYGTAVPQSLTMSGRRSFAVTTNHGIWQVAGAAAPTEPFGPPAAPIQ